MHDIAICDVKSPPGASSRPRPRSPPGRGGATSPRGSPAVTEGADSAIVVSYTHTRTQQQPHFRAPSAPLHTQLVSCGVVSPFHRAEEGQWWRKTLPRPSSARRIKSGSCVACVPYVSRTASGQPVSLFPDPLQDRTRQRTADTSDGIQPEQAARQRQLKGQEERQVYVIGYGCLEKSQLKLGGCAHLPRGHCVGSRRRDTPAGSLDVVWPVRKVSNAAVAENKVHAGQLFDGVSSFLSTANKTKEFLALNLALCHRLNRDYSCHPGRLIKQTVAFCIIFDRLQDRMSRHLKDTARTVSRGFNNGPQQKGSTALAAPPTARASSHYNCACIDHHLRIALASSRIGTIVHVHRS